MSPQEITSNSPDGFVLVVDSEPRSLISACMVIQRLGYRACSALGVGNAMEIVGASVPRVVITDLHLKGLSGLDLLERLKQKPDTSSVPVFIMARERSPEVAHRCRKGGAAACLEKPLNVHELYGAICPLVEPVPRRRDVRLETRLAVTVNDRFLDCLDGECAVNLSVKGMYLRTKSLYPENSNVVIRLKINDENIEADARVVYCRPAGDDGSCMWGVGVQFLKMSPGAGEIIRGFINDEVMHGIDAPGM